jgi:hypothetical protein
VVAIPVILLVVVAALATGLIVPRWRRRTARSVGFALGGVVAVYLVGRGIAEFWVIDLSRPETYVHDWGGPRLVGVLAVHTGPAVVIVIAAAMYLERRWTCAPGRIRTCASGSGGRRSIP